MTELLTGYEAVPYHSRPIEAAAPDVMAAMATLHGVTPVPVDRCRVLELGCAAGGNLIDLAFTQPKSRFVGIDLAPSQVAIGQLTISEMGLQNVSLHAGSIDQIPADFGEFDYIICHGVYSWVPPHVQDAILRTCASCLSPNGVAYVSYNTYPGWHRRAMLREMLMYHDDELLSPAERVARAREFGEFLSAAVGVDDTDAHSVVVREEVEHLRREADYLLYHEQLEPYNQPVYFTEFVRRAGTFGLQYLADARMTPTVLAAGKRVETVAGAGADRVRTQQYLDFIAGRSFRKTLLCRADLEVARAPLVSTVPQLHVRGLVTEIEPSAEDAARGPGVAAFRSLGGTTMTTNNTVLVTALRVLMDFAPMAVSFRDLREAVSAKLRESSGDTASTVDEADLASLILRCAENAFASFRSLPSRFVAKAGKRPKASSFARWQCLYSEQVNSLAHLTVQITPVERFLLPHLDGTNDRAQLIRMLERAFQTGELAHGGGSPSREQLADILEDILEQLGRSAVLVA